MLPLRQVGGPAKQQALELHPPAVAMFLVMRNDYRENPKPMQ